jgi:L-galactose dehydrogenase
MLGWGYVSSTQTWGHVRFQHLGSSHLEVSTIGFGASSLGNVFGEISAADAQRAVDAAIAQGINIFDVSPFYGLTLAEQRLGEALAGKRDDVLIATKCGRYGADEFDFSAATITREFESSLRRLRTDHVDILQAHDIEFGDIGKIVNETIPAMRRLQEQGKVRFIGLTGYWPGLLARVADETGVDCVLNYCHANLFVDDMAEHLACFAQRPGMGLFNASPLHMGLLGSRPIPDWHPASSTVRAAAVEVRRLCARYEVDPATLALSACLDHTSVTSTFIGISSEAEVTAACSALHWTPPEGFMQQVRAIVAPVRNTVWPSGLPENQDQ